MRIEAVLLLALAAVSLCACPKRQTQQPDYDATRQRAEDAHRSLDQENAQPR